MIPYHCRVKHDPEAGTYGDCFRASIASILSVDPIESVPHFFHDGDVEGFQRFERWLLDTWSMVPFWTAFDGSLSLAELLSIMRQNNPNAPYLLFGSTGENDHVVICKGGRVVHNTAWLDDPLKGPTSAGQWLVMVMVMKA